MSAIESPVANLPLSADQQIDVFLDLSEVQNLFIAGESVPALSGETFVSRDPSTDHPLATVALADSADVDRAVAAAREAFQHGPWPRMRAAERGRILVAIATELRANADALARLESLDVGKPLAQGYADVETCARYFEFYGGIADKLVGTTIPVAPHLLDYTVKEPIGVSGQIIPFNYPMQNTGRGGAPALAVGCTVVLKPSPESPLSPLAVAALALRAGLPAGVLNVVPGGPAAGAALAGHPGIDQVTFTGSVPTGVSVAQAAAANVVPAVLELGGKSPSVVFGDADVDRAVNGIMGSIFSNAGQTCSAGTRLLLQRGPGGDRILEVLIERTKKLSIGRGIDGVDLGPLISARQRDKVESFVDAAVSEGAELLSGGSRPDLDGDGYFFEPTILRVASNSATIAQTEVFGPVLTVIPFDTIDEAAAIANDTQYGLSAYVWTTNIDAGLAMASRIRSGQVNVNTYNVGTGIEIPFGGFKKSGWGREKGIEGLASYTQVKNVCIGIGEEYLGMQ
ncbi:MAG: aldehyde dehydrogenase [Subtercola sp.]|nr:aldehyde dehydrogenase [Subtercola sp.]